ncbi:MAG TPA: hypothetical protein VLF94_06450 [Chlamydiales bacterium]|nr:hypothetical protein [Chlamydiales bacterium]
MASAALPPISIENNRLNFGKHSLPLDRAKSFWVRNKEGPEFEMDVYSHNEDYQTTFRLMFDDVRTLHSAIRNFLDKTALDRSGIFCVRQVKPIISSEAAVEFKFSDRSDLDFFRRYAAPLFQDYRFEETGRVDMRMTSETPETPEAQVNRIQTIFDRIKEKLGEYCIRGALIALRDQRFPEKPYPQGGSTGSKGRSEGHLRDFEVTRDEIAQIIDVGGGVKMGKEVNMADVEEWLAHPEAHLGEQAALNKNYLPDLLTRALSEVPVDREKVKRLMGTALPIPGFDLTAVMERVAKAKAGQKPATS